MKDAVPQVAEQIIPSLGAKRPASQPTAKPSEQRVHQPSVHLKEMRSRAAWARKVAGWQLVATAVIWGGAAVAWFILWVTPKSVPVAFDSRPTLRDATRTWARGSETPNFDQLSLCLQSALPALYAFECDGPQMRPFIKGVVAPRLIADADAAFRRDRTVITQRGIRQVFSMRTPSSADVKFDEESLRVSIVVRGQFELSFTKEPKTKPVTLPFAARVILSRNIPSALNPFNFYVEDIVRNEP